MAPVLVGEERTRLLQLVKTLSFFEFLMFQPLACQLRFLLQKQKGYLLRLT